MSSARTKSRSSEQWLPLFQTTVRDGTCICLPLLHYISFSPSPGQSPSSVLRLEFVPKKTQKMMAWSRKGFKSGEWRL